jgi:hypothetical protein
VGKGGGEKGAEEPLATKVMSGREREGVGWVFGLARTSAKKMVLRD